MSYHDEVCARAESSWMCPEERMGLAEYIDYCDPDGAPIERLMCFFPDARDYNDIDEHRRFVFDVARQCILEDEWNKEGLTPWVNRLFASERLVVAMRRWVAEVAFDPITEAWFLPVAESTAHASEEADEAGGEAIKQDVPPSPALPDLIGDAPAYVATMADVLGALAGALEAYEGDAPVDERLRIGVLHELGDPTLGNLLGALFEVAIQRGHAPTRADALDALALMGLLDSVS